MSTQNLENKTRKQANKQTNKQANKQTNKQKQEGLGTRLGKKSAQLYQLVWYYILADDHQQY